MPHFEPAGVEQAAIAWVDQCSYIAQVAEYFGTKAVDPVEQKKLDESLQATVGSLIAYAKDHDIDLHTFASDGAQSIDSQDIRPNHIVLSSPNLRRLSTENASHARGHLVQMIPIDKRMTQRIAELVKGPIRMGDESWQLVAATVVGLEALGYDYADFNFSSKGIKAAVSDIEEAGLQAAYRASVKVLPGVIARGQAKAHGD